MRKITSEEVLLALASLETDEFVSVNAVTCAIGGGRVTDNCVRGHLNNLFADKLLERGKKGVKHGFQYVYRVGTPKGFDIDILLQDAVFSAFHDMVSHALTEEQDGQI